MVRWNRVAQIAAGFAIAAATLLWTTELATPQSQRTQADQSSEESVTELVKLTPIAGLVQVHLYNNMGTELVLEAPGYTVPIVIAPGKEITIQNLPTPATVKISRIDGGLLKVQPVMPKAPNVLDVAIDEASPLSDDSGTLQIQRDGQVLMNP